MTFVRVKLAMEALQPGEQMAVRLNGGEPLTNVPRSLKDEGYLVEEAVEEGEHYLLKVVKPK